MAYYYDSSALVGIVVDQRRSPAMRRWWSRHAARAVASQLVRTELVRTVRRISPSAEDAALAFLDGINQARVTPAILDAATRLDPVSLRSLDAIHLATALDLGDDLEGFVTYDDRLAAAARGYGLVVVRPE